MADIIVEQSLWRREHEQPPQLTARSPGFANAWHDDAERLILGFGERTGGVTCPLAVFAQPLNDQYIAVVRVGDQEAGPSGWPAMAFHILILERLAYETYFGNPFAVSAGVPLAWASPRDLPTLTWPAQALPMRTVAEVQAVLKRVKAWALREGEDPEADVERTVENSESPALLGGAQVLVDGGKLVFVRGQPDNDLVQGLWTLLPNTLRAKLWPASFAFNNDLGFDVIVAPRIGDGAWEGYTTEEQAANYPAGSYEIALQTAAEAGDQAGLDAVFMRRTSNDTLRLAWQLLLGMSLLVIGFRMFWPEPQPLPFLPHQRAALAAGIIAVGDPWLALALIDEGHRRVQRDKGRKP